VAPIGWFIDTVGRRPEHPPSGWQRPVPAAAAASITTAGASPTASLAAGRASAPGPAGAWSCRTPA